MHIWSRAVYQWYPSHYGAIYISLHWYCFIWSSTRSIRPFLGKCICKHSVLSLGIVNVSLTDARKCSYQEHWGSYMSAHVLLNLLNELGKRDKMRGLPSIWSLFRNEFNKFNNTRARILDFIYHMTLRLLWNIISGVKNVITASLCMQRCCGRNNVSSKSINH